VRKYLYIVGFILCFGSLYSQKLSFRIDWNVIHQLNWQVNNRVTSDTNFYNGSNYFIDQFKPKNNLLSDLPGTSVEFRTKNNFFFSGGLHYSRTKFWDPPEDNETNKAVITFNFHRYQIHFLSGYYFRKNRPLKPFLAGGVSLSVFRARFSFDYDNDYVAYENYFNSAPPFLSGVIRGGFRFGGFTMAVSYSSSLTKTTIDNRLGKITSFTLLSVSADLIRTSNIKKAQYRNAVETDDIKIKKSLNLKKFEAAYFLAVPHYVLPVNRYLQAWQDGSSNYTILADKAPRSSLIPILGVKTSNANGKKRTWYSHSSLGFSITKLIFENAKTQSFSVYPIAPGDDPVTTLTSDIKNSFFNMWFGAGAGYRIKTSPKSYLFAESGLQVLFNSMTDGSTDFEVPPLKKIIITASFALGWKFNHWGIAAQWDKGISKPDAFNFYKAYNCYSIKIIYDFSTR
jgi:hypothetical protein